MNNFIAKTRLSSRTFILLGLTSVITLIIAACSRTDPEVEKGAEIYAQACKVCHAQGINGAPVLGNQANWRERKTQGLDVLVSHAVNGYGLMPAKGGRTELTEEEIRYVVKFMLSQLEEK